MLELLYTSTKTLSTAPSFMVYLLDWDALMAFWGGSIYKVFRDGSTAYLGSGWGDGNGNRVGGRAIYQDSVVGGVWCYPADEITGQPQIYRTLNQVQVPPAFGGPYLDDNAGLYLQPHPYGSGGIYVTIYYTASGAVAGQIAGLGFTPDNLAYIWPGQVAAIKHSTGQVAFIDYIGQKVLWRSSVRPCVASAFDCRYNLIITVESDRLIRIYLLTPMPATLSAPSLTPAAGSCQGSVVRARLTGDAGEPCSGYWVHWDLVGTPAKGSLQKPATRTGADGYAENFYFGPGPGA
ncbi:MAG: hypothetical protein WC443_14485, partial [Desulfobaccales bacterium]